MSKQPSGHQHHLHVPETGNLRVAFFLNFGFTIIEIVGGILTGSLAILSDALHDLGDTLSLGLAWYFQKLSQKETDQKFTYGYGRFSLLGAVINALVLFAGSVFLLTQAIPRLWNPTNPDTEGMMALAVLGIIVNGAAVLKLRKGSSMNERVVSLHLLEDVLGWVAVLIGSILIHFFDWRIIDPLLSVLIAVFILFNIYRNLKQSFKIILQGTPKDIDPDQVKAIIQAVDGVDYVHDMHLWSLDGEFNIMTVHILLKPRVSLEATQGIKEAIRERMVGFDIPHITIEFDRPEHGYFEALKHPGRNS
jgi:cobalt-zinc-cadmium efflux system protein